MLIQQPLYYRDQSGNETSSFDDDDESYSGSEEDDFFDEGDGEASFAGGEDDDDEDRAASESDDGIISPEEAHERARLRQSKIGAKEHQRVFRARIFVLFLLMATAISNALIVYFLTKNKEYEDYYSQVRWTG